MVLRLYKRHESVSPRTRASGTHPQLTVTAGSAAEPTSSVRRAARTRQIAAACTGSVPRLAMLMASANATANATAAAPGAEKVEEKKKKKDDAYSIMNKYF